jgi:ribonuclease P protein component
VGLQAMIKKENKMGVSVSKRNFKSSGQELLQTHPSRDLPSKQTYPFDNLDTPCSFMFFYQTKDRLSYEEINTKTIQLFEKFIAQHKR